MAINLNGTGSITGLTSISSPTISGGSLPVGSASTPGLTFSGDSNTGIYSPGADQIAISTSGTARLSIDATGNVAVDTNVLYVDAANNRVGIGTTTPSALLHTAGNALFVNSGDNLDISLDSTYSTVIDAQLTGASEQLVLRTNRAIRFDTGGSTERARIDSSGRLLVGTSSARTNINSSVAPVLQVEGTSNNTSSLSLTRSDASTSSNPPFIYLTSTGGTTAGSNTLVVNNTADTYFGVVSFCGTDGTKPVVAAQIDARLDGTPGANDMPGRLVFSVTQDGSASPTQRMVIKQNGILGVNVDSPTFNYGDAVGFQVNTSGDGLFMRSGAPCLYLNRKTSDGDLLVFAQDGANEGTISVSGTTVSYNGAHLSRWTQLPGGAERTEILRGTVLSNIDEMCEWGDEENEQLNRMKVSEIEGDKNVAGVFQAWDDDDDTYTNDFYCAMTGDFIIRIAQGVTVQRGDLLMSAGDGTAKPQDDDIIRSKTIAKVTSTNVTCTYEDGSYCVPCVLMAC